MLWQLMAMTNALHTRFWVIRKSFLFINTQIAYTLTCIHIFTHKQYTQYRNIAVSRNIHIWNRYLMKWQKRCNRNCLQMFINIYFTLSLFTRMFVEFFSSALCHPIVPYLHFGLPFTFPSTPSLRPNPVHKLLIHTIRTKFWYETRMRIDKT